MNATFETLGLSAETLSRLKQARYLTPTPIQREAIPHVLEGKDLIGCAATGTGKTAAFVLPLVERLAGAGRGVRVLVLAPTRELVLQIAEHVERFAADRGLKHAVVIGGAPMRAQAEALKAGPQWVLATPGRLVDHLAAGNVSFAKMKALVLDEADRMLDMGFKPELDKILSALPTTRQTLLFSATLGPEVEAFAQNALNEPVRVSVNRSGTPAPRAEQRRYRLEAEEKMPLLLALLSEEEGTTLVFTRTKLRADKVEKALRRAGFKASALHSDRTQNQRNQAMENFRSGRHRILVATDIAARGLDVENIGHVVNFDLPFLPEDYVHRIGRTARVEASGRATTFSTAEDTAMLRKVEHLMRKAIPELPVPREHPLFVEELARARNAQKDPGPPQPGHGTSKKAAKRVKR